jgi:hypothetical protein
MPLLCASSMESATGLTIVASSFVKPTLADVPAFFADWAPVPPAKPGSKLS